MKVLIVAVDSDPSVLRNHFLKHPAPKEATIVHDVRGETARRWGKERLPTSFFVDRGAIIRNINRGHGPGFRARATRWLRALLRTSSVTPSRCAGSPPSTFSWPALRLDRWAEPGE
jgi:hypothetical protein